MIVPMKRVTLLCLAAEREATLEQLRALGVAHLDLASHSEGTLAQARAALATALEADQVLKDTLAGKPLRSTSSAPRACPGAAADLRDLVAAPLPRPAAEDAGVLIKSVLELNARRQQLVNESELLEHDLELYTHFGQFDLDLPAELRAAGITVRLFRAPAGAPPQVEGLTIDILASTRSALYGVACGSEPFPEELHEIALPHFDLRTMRQLSSGLQERIAQLSALLQEQARAHPLLQKELARLREEAQFAAARDSMGANQTVAWITGWLPDESVAALETAARTQGWGLLIRDPLPDELPPTLLRPPRLFRPVLALFKGLGISPAYDEADISITFFCFFSIFFAMLVGDGGYGSLLLLGTWLARRKLPRAPLAPFILMACFSSATIIWGGLSNTWFGCHPAWANNPVSLWLNHPDNGMNNTMLVCFTLGVVHLSIARLGNAMALAPDTKALAQLGWVGVITFMYCMACDIVGIFKTPAFMFPVLIVSLVLIVLFTLKRHELRSQGIELGMLPLSIVGALGDIISYVRLFAVSLASVKVAENFNDMAINNGLPLWAKIIPMIAILLVGHGLNMAMAALSILVHAVRLNTLEFSNHKGISWAGYAFNPFQRGNDRI